MSYGTLSAKWTVMMIDREIGPNFDLQKEDILEFTGNGDGTGVVKRHRAGATTDWGVNCRYVATPDPMVTGDHGASKNGAGEYEDKFELFLPVMHAGRITKKSGSGTGGHGAWTAEEGG